MRSQSAARRGAEEYRQYRHDFEEPQPRGRRRGRVEMREPQERSWVYGPILEALSKVSPNLGMRVVHHAVQRTHIHLVVEAESAESLGRGMQGLSVRLARAINRALERRGSVFVDRYHAEPLRSPRQVRNALAYVLNNERHHAEERNQPQGSRRRVDRCTSGAWFDGWRGPVSRLEGETRPPPHPPPRTWLLRTGWRRHGLIAPDEVPGPPAEWRRLAGP